MATKARLTYVEQFYALLAGLEQQLGGVQTLSHCTGRMRWP